MKVKVCGMREAGNIYLAEKTGVDLMGFIFYPGSSRYVGAIDPIDTDRVKRVGVFVNEDNQRILDIARTWKLDVLQLHGNESPEDCALFHGSDLEVVKAFSVDSEFDFARLGPYKPYIDYFLFDTKGDNYGGNGLSFDWQILDKYPFEVPFWLSGGIGPDSVPAISLLNQPLLHVIDVNSGFEDRPGYKNIEKLKKFVDEVQDR